MSDEMNVTIDGVTGDLCSPQVSDFLQNAEVEV
jgi:hypothetical protein